MSHIWIGTHWLPILVVPARQVKSQVPILQNACPFSGLGQAVPQLPQLAGVFRGVQLPPQQPLPLPQSLLQALQ